LKINYKKGILQSSANLSLSLSSCALRFSNSILCSSISLFWEFSCNLSFFWSWQIRLEVTLNYIFLTYDVYLNNIGQNEYRFIILWNPSLHKFIYSFIQWCFSFGSELHRTSHIVLSNDVFHLVANFIGQAMHNIDPTSTNYNYPANPFSYDVLMHILCVMNVFLVFIEWILQR
jgi:hypothetical protein